MGIIELGAAVVTLLAIAAVIGVPAGWLIGLRGLWLAAAAPAFAATIVGVAAVVAPWVGVSWSLLPVLVVAAVIAGLIALVRRLLPGRPPLSAPARGHSGWWTAGVLVAVGLVLTWQVAAMIGSPDAISQTFDNVFHLNAVRYILDTGTASPLQIGLMTSPIAGFYPAVWHAFAALAAQVTGASIPVAVNALTIVVSAVFWPLGALLLARVLAGRALAVTVVAGVVAASVPAFPLLPADYGVLYPLQLALALVPVPLAATAAALRIGDESRRRPFGWWVLVLLGSIAGVALAHPGGFVAWIALTVPMVGVVVVRLWRRFPRPLARVGLVGAVGVYLVVGILLLKVLRPPLEARLWPTVMDPLEAVWHVLTVTIGYPVPSLVVAAAIVLGLVWAVRERTAQAFVAVGMWAVGAVLFIVVTASPWIDLRDAFTGSWYNNWQRLASVFAVALVPLAALGGSRTASWISGRMPRTRLARTLGVVAAIAVAVLAIVPVVPSAVATAHRQYIADDEAVLLSADEFALLTRLPDHVPADAVIAGNPYTGTPLAYALSGRHVLMPHILAYESDEMREVSAGLRDAEEDPSVCEALDALGVRFVLDFGPREVHGQHHDYPGYSDLAASDAVRLVDEQGDARLYEIVACQ
ncbi:DUF6541 family protein [Microbacterium sp. NPDC019599]|uniref:DUF6541 family protein n=1 Tax=Microbacterium sp. NPDC019599 TaxID=3154690 RepID=UPI0033E2B099